FMPRKKELLFFGSDLSYATRPTRAEYLRYFSDTAGRERVGTAHTAYLQSARAASEIKAVRPDADIIVMLRNPVDVIPAWHSELLYQAVEDTADLSEALDAEPERRSGQRLPPHVANSYVESLFYSDVGRFSEQVSRYYAIFGREHVHVILYDDFSEDPRLVYRRTLEFLKVRADFEPVMAVVNANKRARSARLQALMFHSEGQLRRLGRLAIPRNIRSALIRLNTSVEPRVETPRPVRRQLLSLFEEDIVRLGDLVDRDLTHWLTLDEPG